MRPLALSPLPGDVWGTVATIGVWEREAALKPSFPLAPMPTDASRPWMRGDDALVRAPAAIRRLPLGEAGLPAALWAELVGAARNPCATVLASKNSPMICPALLILDARVPCK